FKVVIIASSTSSMSDEAVENSDFWKNRRVLVAGGAGVIGGHLVERLLDVGARVKVADNLENESGSRLLNKTADLLKLDLADARSCQIATKDAEVVYNAAAKVAGVSYNSTHPGEMFHRNTLVNRSEEHTSELQSPCNLVCRLLLEKKNTELNAHIVALTPATSLTGMPRRS